MYARNARGASGYPNAFASEEYPHFNYPDDTTDNDYYSASTGHGTGTGSGNGGDEIESEGDEVKKMPDEYYQSLDQFLNKGPPRLRVPGGGGGGGDGGGGSGGRQGDGKGKKMEVCFV